MDHSIIIRIDPGRPAQPLGLTFLTGQAKRRLPGLQRGYPFGANIRANAAWTEKYTRGYWFHFISYFSIKLVF